jgi:hypothetical protein
MSDAIHHAALTNNTCRRALPFWSVLSPEDRSDGELQGKAPGGIVPMYILLLLRNVMWAMPDNRSGGAAEPVLVNDMEGEPAEPISEAERSRLLNEAIARYRLRGFFVKLRPARGGLPSSNNFYLACGFSIRCVRSKQW